MWRWKLEESANRLAEAGEDWDTVMATKPNKNSRDEFSVQSARASQPPRSSSGRARDTSSQANKKSFLEDDFFGKLLAKDIKDEEGSSASSVDAEALLQTLKDMDDMDADLLGLPKPSSGPGKTTVKGSGKSDSLGGEVKTAGKLPAPEKEESVPVMEKKPLSSPSASQQYKKFSFGDIDDPLAGLLSDEEQDVPKKPAPAGTKSSSEKKMEQSKEKEPSPAQPPQHSLAPARRRPELTFEDDVNDDLMDALGFGSDSKGDKKQGKKTEEEELRPARSKLDELLGQDSVAKVLQQPGLGEFREFKLDKKYQQPPEKEEGWEEDDFVFGGYQPTVASMPKGQLSRRQSLSRFAAENSEPKLEPHSKPPPAASQSSVQSSRAGGHWLGLKDEDFLDSEPPSPAKGSPTGCQPSPATAGQPSSTSQLLAAQEAEAKPIPLEEEEDWLTTALAHKKAQAQVKAQERNAKPSGTAGGGLDASSPVSQPPTSSTGAPQQAAALQDKAASTNGSGWLSTTRQASAQPLEAVKADPSRDTSTSVPTALFPGEQEAQGTALLTQVTTSRAQLQAAPQLQAESPALGLLHERRLGAPTAQPYEDASGCWSALLSAQARIAELESKVQIQELERTRHRLLLESLQQQHQEDLDLLKTAHRAALQEMRKDHEEQLQRLKRLKDQEVEAVTSVVSHTRSLNGIVEQMEKLCSDFHSLSHKMEAMHHTTCQELATEARQRDKQLKVLQDRLSQQQRGMEEEWSRLQEVIGKMEVRLSEQTRLLEQERRRATAEQSKVESLQHSLEEQRRGMTHQLSMERAELERAKEQAELQGRQLKAKEEQLARDRMLLDKGWQELRLEKEKVNRAALHIRQQEEELKSTAKLSSQKYKEGEQALQLSSQKYEEGERALREASRKESEEQSRLLAMQQQLEKLTQYEQQLQQERLSMAHQRRQLEKLCEELSLTRNQNLSAPRKGLSSMQFPPTVASPDSQAFVPDFLPPLSVLARNSLEGYKPTLSMSSPSEFYTKLLLLKYQAQQEHADLENVRLFLESLKKETYNTSSLSS